MKWENTLMAYEKDIKEWSFWNCMKAHTSFFKSLHRYEGVLQLGEKKLTFEGKDIEEDKSFSLEVPLKNLTDVYLGWDKVFKGVPMSRTGDRAYPWNKPLRIRYKRGGEEKTIYLFARFHRRWGIRASDNKEVYGKLKEYVEGKHET